ncbi:MAG: HD-GYP domain-containing protein [Planctomycetota bacterium]
MSTLDFIPISVSTLVPTDSIGLDLYQVDEESSRKVLFRGSDYPHPSDIERLKGRGVSRLYIEKSARDRYQEYLRDLASTDDAGDIPIAARTGAMTEVVRDVLENSFTSGETGQIVESAQEMGAMTAGILSDDDFSAGDMFRVLHHDYATFTHSANVAFYAGLLASEMGFTEDEVAKVTVGGLLHDVGKLAVDDRILCKPGKLDDEEFRRIRMHPLTGFRQLVQRDDLCEGQLLMAYQHHERMDGKGYPVGLVAEEIHDWGRLCAVVDVFEALTSQRPYRQPMPRAKALELMHRDNGTAFDPEMLACWTSIIQTSVSV